MMPGLSLSTFTMPHVIISLVGIVSGLIVLSGLLGSNRMPGLTALFLLTTILTSLTGFGFPFTALLPSHMVGALSLVLLAIACIALYGMKLSGAWRWIYAVTALLSLYLNVFVLVIQGFLKVPALHALAPGEPPGGPVFAVVQLIVLVFFVMVIIGAVRRYRALPASASTLLVIPGRALTRARNLDQQPPDSGFDAARRTGMAGGDTWLSPHKGA